MKIAFFGDSICVGQGISIHKGWVAQLSRYLHEQNTNDQELLVFNSSVNGRTSRQALENMPYEIQSHNPNILIIQFGMNDCNYWESDKGMPRVSKKAFKANIEEIIERGLNFGAKKIIVNTNHPTPITEKFNYASISYQESNERYNSIIRSINQYSETVIINDINTKIYNYLEHNKIKVQDIVLKDRIHLSELGHNLYFQFTIELLKTMKNVL